MKEMAGGGLLPATALKWSLRPQQSSQDCHRTVPPQSISGMLLSPSHSPATVPQSSSWRPRRKRDSTTRHIWVCIMDTSLPTSARCPAVPHGASGPTG